MSGILVDEGGLKLLRILFGTDAKATVFTLRLMAIMAAVLDADNNTTHTVATGGGYADVTLANDATIALVAGIPMATWTLQTWTFTGPLTGNPAIVGYQILIGTTLIAEELLPARVTPLVAGDYVKVVPKMALGNGTPI